MTTDQRLARVERQCRLFKAGFALMTVALAAVLLIGAGQDQDKSKVLEEVRAKRFVLVGETGEARANLATFQENPKLVLMDKRGLQRVVLGVDETGSSLRLLDESGTQRLLLSGHQSGAWVYLLGKGEHQHPRMGMSFDEGETHSFFVTDRTGATRVQLGSMFPIPGPRDSPFETYLTLFDKNGKVIFQAP